MPLEFTDEQRAVINHTLPGHGRVFAGPGTGKSATAVALADSLLKNGEKPPRIKFLTFTRAATLELAKKLISQSKTKPATVHSFSIATLLANPGSAPFPDPLRVADRFEYEVLVRPHVAMLARVGLRKLDDLVREMAAKWESLNPAEMPDVTPDERARFMGAYTEQRRTFGYTLLNELPELLRCALRDHGDLVGTEYDLLIVDEYQDLNACELELLRRLGERGSSILAIGDDDQSIYSFRKAHPIGIQRFVADYPGAQDYALNICQRLPRCIAEWAQFVIGGQTGRMRAGIRCRADAPLGIAKLLNFGSEIAEARGVADLIVRLNQTQGIPLSEILILCRTDNHGTFTRLVRQELSNRQISVHDSSEIDRMLREPLNRRLLCLLRLAVHRQDSLAWRTLVHLERGLGEEFVKKVYGNSVENGNTFGATFLLLGEIEFAEFSSAMKSRALNLYMSTIGILDRLNVPEPSSEIRWGKWITGDAVAAAGLPEPTVEFKTLLVKIDETYIEPENGLGRYLSQIQPLSEDFARSQSEGVRIMTMVSSKGLTVKATILMGVDNDLIPRVDQDLAEERRLLYVAMTRSTDALFLTWVNRRRGPGARAGNPNTGRRTYSEFLRGGPVESENGPSFVQNSSQ
jgi:DNA helicase-2/ATP-dependent DNA helicase PcrA